MLMRQKRIFLTASRKESLNYNGSKGMLYVNSVKIYQFKAKDSGIKLYLLLYSFC